MKLKNCFSVAFFEIKNEKHIFIFFILIFTLLFSVSVAVMDAAIYLPEHINNEIHSNQLDTINVNSFSSPDELNNYFESKDIKIDIIECQPSYWFDLNESTYNGSVLYEKYTKHETLDNITAHLVSGKMPDDFFYSENILVSKDMAEKEKLSIGDGFGCYAFDENVDKQLVANLKVCGIYDFSGNPDYYVSENVQSEYSEKSYFDIASIYFSPEKLRDIFDIERYMKNDGLAYTLSEQLIKTIRMLYITFYSVNIILLFALSGTILNLLNMYFDKRQKFYAVNSAIGMSSKSIITILFCISELLITAMLILSVFVSGFILMRIELYASNLFVLPKKQLYVPFVPLMADYFIIQLCLFVILFKFRKKLKRYDITDLLHYE